MCEITFTETDIKTFPQQSSYFASLFAGEWKDKKRHVVLEGEETTIRQMIQMMRGEEVEGDVDVVGLLLLADRFDVSSIVKDCLARVSKCDICENERVFELLAMADVDLTHMFHKAVRRGSLGLIRLIHDHPNTDLDVFDRDINTVLDVCISNGWWEKALLLRNVSLTSTFFGEYSDTIVHLAVRTRNAECVAFALTKMKTRIDVHNSVGQTALDLAQDEEIRNLMA